LKSFSKPKNRKITLKKQKKNLQKAFKSPENHEKYDNTSMMLESSEINASPKMLEASKIKEKTFKLNYFVAIHV
jgi:hypothetical protein